MYTHTKKNKTTAENLVIFILGLMKANEITNFLLFFETF